MRVLIVKLSSIGDVLHALPMAAELADQLPATIDWAVQPAFAPLVRLFSCVETVHAVPRPSDLVGYVKAIRRIRMTRYDCVVDAQGLMKSAVVARFVRAPRRVGPSFAREGSHWLYSECAGMRDKNRHAVEECLDVVRHLGLRVPGTVRFPIDTPALDLDERAPLHGTGIRVAVAPQSRWPSKNWPAASFSVLIRMLVARHDARVYVLGGAADAPVADQILAEAGVPAVNLCGRFSLAESMAAIRQCRVMVTNDSGPMHMAAALGVRCVVPFGPTAPERTGPYGPDHVVIQTALPCAPCHQRVCPLGTQACLRGITPERVLAAVCDQR